RGRDPVRPSGHSAPYLPRRLPAFPEIVQQLIFAIGIHCVKKARMVVRYELPFGGQAHERLMFQGDLVTTQVIKDLTLEDEESGTGPRVGLRFFDEVQDLVRIIDVENSEARNRTERRHRREPAVALVKFQQTGKVDVTDA